MVDKKLFEKVVESSYDGIFITDKEGLVLFVNKAYERLAGRSRDEYVGNYMDDLMKSGIMKTFISKEVAEKKQTITVTEQLISGKSVIITGNPVLGEGGEVIAVVTNVRDVSHIIHLEKEAAISKELAHLYQKEIFGQLGDDIVCVSEVSKQVMAIARKVALKESTVLITGETGVGKEVIAKYIHAESARCGNSYIKINCAAIPKTLLESEFFGYVKGAFTGANAKGKIGIFELANGGTLFLDEIGELPLDMQSSLLRVLQEGEITRVGDERSRKVDVRIVAATNRNLVQMVEDGTFRSDLFYRLNVISISIPPLAKRIDDIPALAELFVRKLNKKYSESKLITRNFTQKLCEKEWPGNIRELSNFVERQYIMQEGQILNEIVQIDMDMDRLEGRVLPIETENMAPEVLPNLEEAVEELEKRLVLRAMELGKTTSGAAKLLGISQPTLSRKYSKYKE